MYNPVGPVMNFSSERELTGVDAMKGLTDIEVNEEGDDFRIKTDTDNQLNYAIKLLNG